MEKRIQSRKSRNREFLRQETSHVYSHFILIGVLFHARVFHKMSPLPSQPGTATLKASCCDFDSRLQNDLIDAGGKGFGFCLFGWGGGLLFSWGVILTLGWDFEFGNRISWSSGVPQICFVTFDGLERGQNPFKLNCSLGSVASG